MYNKKISIAIIGGSINSTIGSTHIKSIYASNKYNIICGMFSKNTKINLDSGKKYDLKKDKIYFNINDLIKNEKENIDLAVVIVPPDEKYKILKKLVENKIGIIVEKPLSSNLTDAKKILDLVNKKKIFFFSTYNYIHYPAILEMKSILKKIGKLIHFNIEMTQQSLIHKNFKIKKWRQKDRSIPNLYLDLASHCFAMIQYFTKEKAIQIKNIGFQNIKNNLIDNSYAILRYKKLYGKIWVSKNCLGDRNNFKISFYGNKGSIHWKHSNPENLLFYDNNGSLHIIDRLEFKSIKKDQDLFTYTAGHPNGFLDAFINMYNFIYLSFNKKSKTTSDKNINIKNNFEIMRLMHAMNLSNLRKNIWIKL